MHCPSESPELVPVNHQRPVPVNHQRPISTVPVRPVPVNHQRPMHSPSEPPETYMHSPSEPPETYMHCPSEQPETYMHRPSEQPETYMHRPSEQPETYMHCPSEQPETYSVGCQLSTGSDYRPFPVLLSTSTIYGRARKISNRERMPAWAASYLFLELLYRCLLR